VARAAVLVFLASFLVLSLTLDDYGITWDEAGTNFPAARKQAEWLGRFLSSGTGLSGEDVRAGFETESDHPSLPRTLMALSRLVLPDSISDRVAFAVPTAILASFFLSAFFLLLKTRLGWSAALSGTAFLFLHPRWFAHSHLAAYDIQIAIAWWMAAMGFYIAAQKDREGGLTRWGYWILAAVLFGAALSVKLHAFFIPFPLLAWAIFHRRWEVWRWGILVLVSGPVIYLLTQPYLWWDTWSRVVARFSDYQDKWPIACQYFGETYVANIPWHYPWVMLGVTLPPGLLIFFLVYLISRCSSKGSLKGPLDNGGGSDGWESFVVLNAVTTPLLFSFKSPYDGIRLFLVALPFLAMLAAAGVDRLERMCPVKKSGKQRGWIVAVLAAILVATQAVTCYRLHPYQLGYYSFAVGGVRGAQSLGFETTYWCDGITPGFLEELAGRVPEDARIKTFAFDSLLLEEYQRAGVVPETWKFDSDGPPDVLIIQFRQGLFREGERVLVESGKEPLVERTLSGVPLVRAYAWP